MRERERGLTDNWLIQSGWARLIWSQVDESVIDPDTIPDAVRSYNVDILDGTPYYHG